LPLRVCCGHKQERETKKNQDLLQDIPPGLAVGPDMVRNTEITEKWRSERLRVRCREYSVRW
jgi:hypothetical protein